ncbi:reduced folate carrier family protein [Cavenderia fasciculata]|uniref:Reduced folate carrier family protein n=1 Tax=Cavenderia fasciculata TaxID=261658 RepID=F4PHU1_CACFS|nr:reduced folate carrier family protein [Cavenderia fasciculata]EGG25275.1 reduced folate carrier family protein [Cavenderia fasciculata]|eukprot:XP_004363126.1 reduced folate carrier family protein [Cavenderia fasciculata]
MNNSNNNNINHHHNDDDDDIVVVYSIEHQQQEKEEEEEEEEEEQEKGERINLLKERQEEEETNSIVKDTLLSFKSFILYCSFSFLFSFDPSEPYIVEYLTNVLHVNSTVVYETIYPYWTYSYFIFLLVFGFLGEMIGYKSIIIIGMIGKVIASTILLIGTQSIGLLIVDQVADGMAFAAYIFGSKGLPDDGMSSQCWLFGWSVEYVPLIALVTVGSITNVIALIVAICFTNHRSEQLFSFRELCGQVLSAYKQTDIIRWYIWSGVAISIHQIVLTCKIIENRKWKIETQSNQHQANWQSLFLQTNNEEKWNGYISSSAYFFASFVAIIPARLGNNNINNIKNVILIGFGLIGGLFLILMGIGESIIISAISFVVYNCCFEFMSPIVNVQIAKRLNTRIGILFSFNIMIALAIQVIIQLSVGERMLNLDIKSQFFYFGSCLFVLSLGFAILFTFLYFHSKYKSERHHNHHHHHHHRHSNNIIDTTTINVGNSTDTNIMIDHHHHNQERQKLLS